MMTDGLTLYQRIRIWLSDFSFMEKPLNWFENTVDKIQNAFAGFGVYMRYIVILFLLTIFFVLFIKFSVGIDNVLSRSVFPENRIS